MENKLKKLKRGGKTKIIIESPKEIEKYIVGSKLINFEIRKGDDAYCAENEIFMDFNNGKEMRIYVDDDGDLCVYSD